MCLNKSKVRMMFIQYLVDTVPWKQNNAWASGAVYEVISLFKSDGHACFFFCYGDRKSIAYKSNNSIKFDTKCSTLLFHPKLTFHGDCGIWLGILVLYIFRLNFMFAPNTKWYFIKNKNNNNKLSITDCVHNYFL